MVARTRGASDCDGQGGIGDPRDPRSTADCYDWWIAFGALVPEFVAIGVQAPVVGTFLVPMTTNLGSTRADFSIVT